MSDKPTFDPATFDPATFDSTSFDPAAEWHTLRNARGMRVTISSRGATLVSWWAPDRYGRAADILLGFTDPAGYADNKPYFGAQVGRVANRIAGARFTLDGEHYQLDRNDGENQLHGGAHGFHQAYWSVAPEAGGLRFSLRSPAGQGGYPGNVSVSVLYRLGDDGALSMEYEASSDAATPLALTSHPYFNLNGGSAGIGDHLLRIDADDYLPVGPDLIPSGRSAVAGSAFDFRQLAPIGPRLGWPDPQVAQTGGFDHCFCLQGGASALREVAQVLDPGSGRQLTVETTEPGLQFYSGNFLAGVQGRGPVPYAMHDGFCLEAQTFPNQVNGPDAQALILRPGRVYRQSTVYRLQVV